MSPAEFSFRHELLNYLDNYFNIELSNKDIDICHIETVTNDKSKTDINIGNYYQEFLQSSKDKDDYFGDVYDSIRYDLNKEKENEEITLE